VHDTQNNTIKQVEYMDGFQYAGGMLQFFPHAEGYVAATPGGIGPGGYTYIFNYVYNYTDHLGNIRLSYTKDPVSGDLEIMEENHSTSCASFDLEILNFQNLTCPFGLKHSVYADPKQMYKLDEEEENLARPTYVYETEYQYKYNGKEWQDELGLGMYDYGWRQYDPAIARWVVPDPLSEKFYPSSLYNYTVNNPILLNDPDGRDWVITFDKDKGGNLKINITVNAAIVNNSGKEIDIDNYIKEQTAQFNRIFSFEGEGVSITANLNMRAISSEDEIEGSEHLIVIGDPNNFASNLGGYADYGGLRVDMNGGLINEDGTTDYNANLSHEIGHTGGLIHPFSKGNKISFFDGYSFFGLKENRKSAPVYKQKDGADLKTNFMSYPHKYYNKTNKEKELIKTYSNPGKATGNQLGALIRYYGNGLLNKDNR